MDVNPREDVPVRYHATALTYVPYTCSVINSNMFATIRLNGKFATLRQVYTHLTNKTDLKIILQQKLASVQIMTVYCKCHQVIARGFT